MGNINFGQAAADMAIGAGGKVVSGVIDAAFNEAAAKKAYERQKEFYQMQYKDNSPGNRVKQLEEAGLSVGLMYGNGASGTGGSVAAPNVPQAHVNTGDMGLGLQNRIMQAQANNLEADANLKNVQANKLGGVDTDKAGAEIDVLKADAALKSKQIELNEVQKRSIELKNNFDEKNWNVQLEQNLTTLGKTIIEKDVAEATKESAIELIKQNVADTMASAALKMSNIKLNEEQIKAIKNSINVANNQIDINRDSLRQAWDVAVLNQNKGIISQELRGLPDAVWGLIDKIKNRVTGE